MTKVPDPEVGTVYGKWTVLSKFDGRRDKAWLCRCECGTKRPVAANSLKWGTSRSCGCASKKIHDAVITEALSDNVKRRPMI